MERFKFIITLMLVLILHITYGQSGKITYEIRGDKYEYAEEFQVEFNKSSFLMTYDLRNFKSYKNSKGWLIEARKMCTTFHFDLKSQTGILHRKTKKKEWYFKEKMNKLKWTIHNEFDEILGYKVQKATATYDYEPVEREIGNFGRIEVWFANEIPVSVGPNSGATNRDLVIWGLPGAVLKTKFNSTWYEIATKVELYKKNIILESPCTGEEVSKEVFWTK